MTDATLVDTGFWMALFDPRDERHQFAADNGDWVDFATLVMPWPMLYETLRTRFVRHPQWVVGLNDRLKKSSVAFIDDQQYRDDAYSLAVEYSTRLKRPISMVDMLCRLLIADPNVRIDYLLTTNPGDFADLCRKHKMEMLA